MKHKYSGSGPKCLICDYPEIAHTDKATCEACGLEGECEFYPNEKDPRRMLLCMTDFERDRKLMTAYGNSTRAPQAPAEIVLPYQVRTAGEYFNANIPAVVDITKAVAEDESVSNKSYEVAKRVKAHVQQLAKSLFELDKERASIANEMRETQVYYNHLMKELSVEKQTELGSVDITYKQEKAPKVVKVPSVKKFDKNALKEACSKHNIPEYMLQSIVTGRKVTIEEAVKVYFEVMSPK